MFLETRFVLGQFEKNNLVFLLWSVNKLFSLGCFLPPTPYSQWNSPEVMSQKLVLHLTCPLRAVGQVGLWLDRHCCVHGQASVKCRFWEELPYWMMGKALVLVLAELLFELGNSQVLSAGQSSQPPCFPDRTHNCCSSRGWRCRTGSVSWQDSVSR